MFPFAATLAALAASAQPADSFLESKLESFNRAIAAGDGLAAAPLIDEVIASRLPADGKPASDPIVNSMMGQLYLLTGHEGPALEYLARATPSSLPSSMRAETALAYGKALQRHGRRDEALKAFRAASEGATNHSIQFRSSIGAAEQLLPTDPGGALRLSSSFLMSAPAAERWRPAYVSALASSLLGDRKAAAQFADRAWADAVNAPPRDLAPLQVSVLRAGLATIAGEKDSQRAMLAAANAMGVARGDDLTRQLPVCGDNGVTPSDFVIFGASMGPYHTNSLVPIAASRPAIVAAFNDQLAGRAIIKTDNVSSATGTVFTASCVSRVDSGYMKDAEPSDPIIRWFATRGIYPATINGDSNDSGINKVSDRIDEITRRFGDQSPLLIHAQWQLLTLLEARTLAGDPVPPARLVELRSAIMAGMKRNKAPADVVALLAFRAEMDRLMRAAAAEGRPDLAGFQAAWLRTMQKMPFSTARYFIREMVEKFRDNLTSEQVRMVSDLSDRAPETLAGRDKQAFLLMLAGAKRIVGRSEEGSRDAAATGIAPDICVRADTPPAMLVQKFTAEDYPPDLVSAELKGYSLVEFDVTGAGTAGPPRTILSFPSGLFDQATAKGVETMKFTPALVNGKTLACRAHTQGVAWRLEDEEAFSPPTLLPNLTNEST